MKHIEHKGKIKGFGTQGGINFVIFEKGGNVDIPSDVEVTISWDEEEKSPFKK